MTGKVSASPVKVVMFSFSCEPGRGSEPGVGFVFAQALCAASTAGQFEGVILTRSEGAKKTQEVLSGRFPDANVTVVGLRNVVSILGRRSETILRVEYLVWQMRAVLYARRMLGHEWIGHHVTFATGSIPTFEWLLGPRVARVMGPFGSSQQLIRERDCSWRQRTIQLIRGIFLGKNLQCVDLAIANNSWSAQDLRSVGYVGPLLVEPNIALDIDGHDWPTFSDCVRDQHKLAMVGRLIEVKQNRIAIRAMTYLPSEFTLHVIGDGPMMVTLRADVERWGLQSRVQFYGALPHAEAMGLLATSHTLVHPSRQEGSAWVVGEAQSLGVVPVVFRGSGADSIVEIARCGKVVPFGADDEEAAKNLANGVLDAAVVTESRSSRWNSGRLPDLLVNWYKQASEHHLSRTGGRS